MVAVLDVRLFTNALFKVFANHIWNVDSVLFERWEKKDLFFGPESYLTQECHSENYIYSKIYEIFQSIYAWIL